MPATTPNTSDTARIAKSLTFGVDVPLTLGNRALQIWMEMGSEAVRFLSDRLQQDIRTQQAMLRCTSLAEMQKLQAEFLRSAGDQYAAEARRMLELMQGTAAGQIAATTARSYDDVPL